MGATVFVLIMSLLSANFSMLRAIKMGNRHCSVPRVDLSRYMSTTEVQTFNNGDVLITGLNGPQDIMVKVVACREIMQETIIKNDLSPQSGKALGEVLVSTLMMGSGLKGEETLQVITLIPFQTSILLFNLVIRTFYLKVNFVGNTGIRNVMAITDGELKVRGMVGEPRFSNGQGENIRTKDLLGEGQIQIVRNHPSWKQPTNGIVLLRDINIPLNLAFYMAESEQRSAVLLTDVKVEGNLCRYALGVMVERLPGCTDENIEISIKNLEEVEKKGLRSYLDRTDEERKADKGQFRDFTPSLDKILNDCLAGMDFENSIRWSKSPQFRCSCGIERVWRTLRLLPANDVRELIQADGDVEVRCELDLFCCHFWTQG